ncbi:IclR family transcriptional regulator domain-containing protein [Prauserella alba]|uniref:IclR family transcriptional regulator C-terminal domain-containing protein n=1 Tax=Prauserella alba TaxID=176898 RepID=A0ABN1VCI8_9PSEU|nr:IclR family transcriptional regulator C-terminal domain-containing protein [Prauserella alba]MCP2181766.1 transcriptional regulator, IclR family [Prauserella alba]
MVKAPEDKDYVQSLERGLAVIHAFTDRGPRLTLAQLAQATGLSRPTVRRVVLTLERLGYLRTDDREFSLTPRVLTLGEAYLSSLKLTEVAQPHMENVTKVTGHTCSLAVLDGDDAVFVTRVPARPVMRHTFTTGTRLPAYATSMGRVLLAELPDHELATYLAGAPFTRLTASTKVTADELTSALAATRTRGWALVDQEFEEGVRSFSAPVRDAHSLTIASLSMSVRADELSVDEIRHELLPVVMEAAAEISKQLGADTPRI